MICLNSTNIAQQLIEKYAFTDKNVSLCLDSDNAGNAATELLIAALKDQAVVKDIRAYFLIGEQYNDLNDFLQANKFKNHIENITEVEHKKRGI